MFAKTAKSKIISARQAAASSVALANRNNVIARAGGLSRTRRPHLVCRWRPMIGVFPLVEAPTGDARRGLGAGHTREFLPLWLQKSFGGWTTYGGGVSPPSCSRSGGCHFGTVFALTP